jgi:glycosyltransferase involved in cell wall biosynthesis
MGQRVLVASKFVTQYREALYEGLRLRLSEHDVKFDLAYGDPIGDDAKKADSVRLEWAIHVPNKYVSIGNRRLIYQPVAKLSASYDLVIVEQATKLLVNPILLAMNRLKITRVAFWGHGKDFQGGDGLLARRLKRALIPHVHWWFAYNELSAAVVREAGYPDERITRVMNTIDNETLRTFLDEVTPEEVEQHREKLGLCGKNVCVYVGGMYDKKRLPFLLEACVLIRREIPDFEVVFLGSGVDRPLVDQFASKHRWARSCGPTFGRQKAVNLKLAKLLLMPGLVGLAIIDAFTAKVPIVTTRVDYHSPEIDYLIDGVNGEMILASESASDYANAVVSLLRSEERLAILRNGCEVASQKYTMNSMVNRFADGILSALKT